MSDKTTLLVVGFKFTKDDKACIEKIFSGASQTLGIEVIPEIQDLRNFKPSGNLPEYVLAIGDAAATFVRPAENPPVIVTIPKIKEFWEDTEKKEKVWQVIQGLFIDLQKKVLSTVKLVTIEKDRLTLDADAVVEQLNKEEFISICKKTLDEKGPLVIECRDGNQIHIYPETLPKKDKFEYTAEEFFLLMSALMLFDASKAKLAKEG